MKTLILWILMLTIASVSNAQNVNIPDANFKNALTDAGVDTDEDGEISYAEAEEITALYISSQGISDLTGIEAFINLNTLYCGDNQLTTLDVSNNLALISLDCGGNQLTSLDVSKNTALTLLDCSGNQLTNLDVTNNTALVELSCGGNQLTSLDVSKNTAIGAGCWSLLCFSHGLYLSHMPSLHEVCVWTIPFPPKVDTTGSPNVCFQTDCNGDCSNDPIDAIERFHHTRIQLYPNPTGDILYIATDHPEYLSIVLTTLNGHLLFYIECEEPIHQLDLSSLQKGVYFITIRSKDYVTTRKIIKL